jgi:hypothetical protein
MLILPILSNVEQPRAKALPTAVLLGKYTTKKKCTSSGTTASFSDINGRMSLRASIVNLQVAHAAAIKGFNASSKDLSNRKSRQLARRNVRTGLTGKRLGIICGTRGCGKLRRHPVPNSKLKVISERTDSILDHVVCYVRRHAKNQGYIVNKSISIILMNARWYLTYVPVTCWLNIKALGQEHACIRIFVHSDKDPGSLTPSMSNIHLWTISGAWLSKTEGCFAI